MVLFNYSTKELTAKVVYYGPGLCGKTTNLQYIHANLPGNVKGKMLSLATKTDRTLFFDFLPIDLGEIRGMKTRVQLYTVPGQVFYNETRKLVLKGADGIVFVADSQEQMVGANVESFKNLEENLKAHGLKLAEMPHVIQFNKRDLPKLAGIEELNASINRYNAPFYESVATTGIGVQDSLKAITKLVLLHLTKKYDPAAAGTSAAAAPARPAAAAPPAVKREPAPVAATATATARVAASAGAIPLSEVAAAPVTAATAISVEAPAPAPPIEEPVPEFGSDDIDSLVDEVEETVMDAGTPVPFDPAATVAAQPVEIPAPEAELPELSPTAPAEAVAEVATPQLSESDAMVEIDLDDGAALEAAGEALSAPDVPESPQFEVDHQIDPDWSPDRQAAPDPEPEITESRAEEPLASPVPAPPPDDRETPVDLDGSPFDATPTQPEETPGSELETAAEFNSPIEEELAETLAGDAPQDLDAMAEELGVKSASDPTVLSALEENAARQEREDSQAAEEASTAEASQGEVLLTEVVEDADLFGDPGIDVAQIPPRQAHEIVVPVELGAEGETKQRFKLSIVLRLDPVDE